MAKQSGLGASLLVDGYDLSGDVGAVDRISSSSAPLDVTAINASAMERISGLLDGAIDFSHYFNDETAREHLVLRAKSSGANRIVSFLQGATIGNMAAGITAKQVNYDWTRGQDASLLGKTNCPANGSGLDYCEQLTAGLRTDTGATNGASLEGPVGGTALGLAAYLHVTAFTGTDATVTIQESSDDGGGDAFANVTGGGFTQVTGANVAERIVTSLTLAVERYLRVVTTTSGGFTSMTFSVIATRYPYQ